MSFILFLIGRKDTLNEDEADGSEPVLSNTRDSRRSTRKRRKTNFTGMSVYAGQDDTIVFEGDTEQDAYTTHDSAAMDDGVHVTSNSAVVVMWSGRRATGRKVNNPMHPKAESTRGFTHLQTVLCIW